MIRAVHPFSGMSASLMVYLGRQFLASFFGVFLLFVVLIFMIDTVELMRRGASKAAVSFPVVLDMALLKLPHLTQEVLPFVALFGSMIAFWRLNRNNELVVIRSVGMSVWKFIMPALLVVFLVGVFKMAVFNPLAATFYGKYEELENRYLRRQASVLTVSRTGLWLRQNHGDGQSVVHATSVSKDGRELSQVTMFFYKDKDKFVRRADAKTARLSDGYWTLKDVWVNGPSLSPEKLPSMKVKTDLTLEKIQESFASPETISFWELPRFIRILEQAGFSSVRHRLHLQSLIAEPILLCAMVIIAAVFTLRHNRRTGTAIAVVGGVCSGFALFFLSDLISALGLSSSIPVSLAAWIPACASILLGIAMLFHLEDG